MHSVFFRSTKLVKAIKLEEQETVTANWYMNKCLPENFPVMNIRLYLDNTSSHKARLRVNFLKQKHFKVIEYSLYSLILLCMTLGYSLILIKIYVVVVFIPKMRHIRL